MDIILSNTAHSHVFQKVDIDVMHNHDDKHPALSESEIRIHSRFFCPEEIWRLDALENEKNI